MAPTEAPNGLYARPRAPKAAPTTATVAGIINRVASTSISPPSPPPEKSLSAQSPPASFQSSAESSGSLSPRAAPAAKPDITQVFAGIDARRRSSTSSTGSVDGTHLRTAFRNAATSVWVITSSHAGHPVGFTAITVNSVCVDPPMVSFNVGRTSSSLDTLSRSLRFAAHLLREDQGHIATRFSATTSKRFSNDDWSWGEDGLPKLPSLARFSGDIVSFSVAGDNLLAIGRLDNITLSPGKPLVYHGGVYGSLTPPPLKKRIYLNAFDMCCVGHQAPGMWTHPSDRARTYKDLEYWINLAQLLERGGFDSLFLADVVGIYDVYRGSRDAAVRSASQVPVNDPVGPISAMAAVTKRLGFGVTVSLTYELPYAFARRMSTLDHLTKGRVAWNVVTSYLKSAATNLGLETQVPHDERYNIAEEFMEVCYKLWENSWEDDAVLEPAEAAEKGIYAHPDKVHDIEHEGKYFHVPGAHLCEPSPQRTPYLFQAGASTKGQAFAAKHAESVFIAGPTVPHLKKITSGIRASAREQGRDPANVKIFALVTIITGSTEEAAQAKYDEYRQYASIEGALALYGGWAGVDLSTIDVDQPLEYVENDAIRSVNQMWSKQGTGDEVWTPRKIAEKIAIGGLGPLIVGSATNVANQLEQWIDEADLDGFNLAYAVTPNTFEDIIEHVVPELRRRGRVPEQVPDAPRKTLRESMGGPEATAYVTPDHPAYKHKRRQL
ncbi:uncharacterized protein CcaverHIS019_0300150 [Cutaneotrichosporon cavernicola]|uniref:Flavin reductase like domain-containing protein n=1 Tax=Cutaneotrichosporon cavernicola TaxID=279322 RepID=A0AA48L1N6_9TREE|nr:uncharacterized protein CcaverHIS019_0300150 [Cutaneotrichosporon cavernicola]BEI89945.1 hypothetical protein CcaverHIS019_0300150 [Cutaneotrichosporon cavernicola]BEI97718.1 hypothetical protein CcaverHIS631_0300170 [Cutaneotrichosporon cavernicola]BEJ05495.1 hypothetical protein CcaverHIS641_0300170 [Cutaneotrichosporon cavernicola]